MALWWGTRLDGWQKANGGSEFTLGHTDDCGPCMDEWLRANLEQRTFSPQEMDTIRSLSIAMSHFTPGGGNTIADNAWYMRKAGYTVDLHDFKRWYSVDEFRAVLKQCGMGDAVGVELGNAHNLPYNEQNVFYHFVVILAYDEGTDMVLVGNGDRVPAGGPDWLSVQAVSDASICGIILVHKKAAIAPPPQGATMIDLEKDANGVITGAHNHDHPGVRVGEGIAQRIAEGTPNQLDHEIVDLGGGGFQGERDMGGRVVAVLANASSADSIYTYSKQFGTQALRGVPDLAIILTQTIAAADKAATPVTPPPAPKVDVSNEIVAIRNALSSAQVAVNTSIPGALTDLVKKVGGQ